MIIAKGKVYWAPVFFDIDGTEVYIKRKKKLKKLERRNSKSQLENYEITSLENIMWQHESQGVIEFKTRPVLVIKILEKKNKVKVIPIYTFRDKYEGDEYCYNISDSSIADISREFNINKKLLKKQKSLKVNKYQFNEIVTIFKSKMCPEKMWLATWTEQREVMLK